jgi:peptidoglycan/xylan/chitin deacetylase (PgdA/CDA1 family)
VEDFLYDYEQARKIIVDATGNDDISEYLTSYRLPYGYYGMPNTTYRAAIVEEMTRRGFKEFDWNVDTNDWNAATTADEILSRVQSQFKTTGRNIILCHDAVSSKSDDILEDIVDYVLSKGYTFSGILSNSAEQLGGF